ncbi:MAG: hypothetical protein ACLUNZ_00105 [Evtepia sp.]
MKKTPDWLKVSAPAALLPLEGGRALRLLTETEEMQVRREAMELAVNEMDLPLCSNACLVARALVCAGERVYADGRAVLDGLSAEEIEALAERWAAFRREKGVGLGLGEKRLDALKASLAARPRQRLKWRVLKNSWGAAHGAAGAGDDGGGLSLVRGTAAAGRGRGGGGSVSQLPGEAGGGPVPGVRAGDGSRCPRGKRRV